MEDSTNGSAHQSHSPSPSPPYLDSSDASTTIMYSSAALRTESYAPTAGMSQAQQAPLLPSLSQHFETQQAMQSQPPPYGAPLMSNGGPMQQQQPPPPYPPQHFPQYQNGAMPGTPMPPTDGQNVMRYPIPPQAPMDARSMSASRHKKEIKRRTKTGCLTCRKRRIKCDEGHPTCRNCAKSKRECLGYDPIFKQQPGPANIQPAPVGGNPPPQQPHNSGINSAVPHNPYSHPSQSYSGPSGAFASAGASHAGDSHYNEYGSSTSLDPALGGDHAAHMAPNNYPALQPQRRVKQVAVEELFSLNDIPPRYNLREAPPPVSPAVQSEIDTFYKYHYAIGLDRLFETTWYSSRGLAHLQHDNYLQDYVAQCAEQFKAKKNDEPTSRPLLSLEARLVWSLAQMPRATANAANGAGLDPLVKELLPRIDTVENLITGQYLDPSRVPPPAQPSHEPGQEPAMANQKYNERAFWHHLGRFVSTRDDNPTAMKDVGDALLNVRSILNMLENRDVLYSIAIARHIGGRLLDFHPQRQLVASTNDPNDDINKLKVAQQFVEGEDQRGTTQVIQRICSMAIRGWILQKQ